MVTPSNPVDIASKIEQIIQDNIKSESPRPARAIDQAFAALDEALRSSPKSDLLDQAKVIEIKLTTTYKKNENLVQTKMQTFVSGCLASADLVTMSKIKTNWPAFNEDVNKRLKTMVPERFLTACEVIKSSKESEGVLAEIKNLQKWLKEIRNLGLAPDIKEEKPKLVRALIERCDTLKPKIAKTLLEEVLDPASFLVGEKPFLDAWLMAKTLNGNSPSSLAILAGKLEEIATKLYELEGDIKEHPCVELLQAEVARFAELGTHLQTVYLNDSQKLKSKADVEEFLKSLPEQIGMDPIKVEIVMDTSKDEQIARKLQKGGG